jgi:hypothetical protein
MQTNRLFFSSVIFSLVIVFACNKSPLTSQPVPLSADSNYLSKIIYFNWNGSTVDTFLNIFNYDDLKRVTECLQSSIGRTNGIITSWQFDTSRFLYNGSAVLPYEITKRTNVPTEAAQTITNYLSYSNSGKLVKDSTISVFHDLYGNTYFSTTISTYTYTNNQIYIYTTLTSTQPGDSYIKMDTLTLDANTNISTKRSSLNYQTHPQDTTFYIATYTYGTNPSPLVNLNISNRLGISEPGYYFSFQQGSRNNLTSSMTAIYYNSVYFGTIIAVDDLSTYTFKTNGYPDTLNIKYQGSSEIKRLVYQYQSL